jgi:4-hydroxybenzoate polyprenyltransferase
MFPKKGQIWTYRQRGRLFSLWLALPVLVGIVWGTFLAATEGDWFILALSVVGLAGAAVFLIDHERRHRGEP